MKLPKFKYHPDPVSTGAIEASKKKCQCCGEARGYVYTCNVYAVESVDAVCPWCIADGSVHDKYDGSMIDSISLEDAGISKKIIDEVANRTPGFTSWQGEVWLTCCKDACEFHGDPTREELLELDEEGIQQIAAATGIDAEDLPEIFENYEPKGSPSFYKFKCRHCKKFLYYADFD